MGSFIVFFASENDGGQIQAFKVAAETVDEAEQRMTDAGYELAWGMGADGLRDLIDILENPDEPDEDLNHER